MKTHIEEMFPEITRAITIRRSQYYLIVCEKNYVDSLHHKGQIEEKEANMLKNEMDLKLEYLKRTTPVIELADQAHRIIYYSCLSDIFERDELEEAIENFTLHESIYHSNDLILSQDEQSKNIYYVARGQVVEKNSKC